MILAGRHRAAWLSLLAGFALLAGCSDSNQPASSESPSGRDGERRESRPSQTTRFEESRPSQAARLEESGLSQATRLEGYLKEFDPLLKVLVKRFDEAARRVEALKHELSKMPNADPFMAERQAKFRAMGEEMERAQADVEIARRQLEALRVPQEGRAYHHRVLLWVRGVEGYFPAQKRFYENSATFWTEERDAGAWAAYLVQLRQADDLREQLKKEIYSIDRGRKELAAQFGIPSPAAR